MIPAFQPPIWVLLTHASGDNDQCLALAESLGRPTLAKQLDWPAADVDEDRATVRALLADTPEAEQWRQSLGLHAPWPRLVICCGRRATRVAFWIKRQSGGRTKLVAIGRATGPIDDYDLVVATPQFCLPERPNVVSLPLPMVRRARAGRSPGRRDDGPAVIAAPKPWFTILLGGEVAEFADCERVLAETAQRAQMAADRHGGSVVVSTSRRTPQRLLHAVEGALRRPHIHRWSQAAAGPNPYDVLLRQSVALFVTADSASMILDGAASGTPTYVIEYPERPGWRAHWRRALFLRLRTLVAAARGNDLARVAEILERAQDWLHARRILRYPRDLRRFHASIYRLGLAAPAALFDAAASVAPRGEPRDLAELSGIRNAAKRCLDLFGPAVAAAE